MRCFTREDGVVLVEGYPWAYLELQYSADWLNYASQDELDKLGIVEITFDDKKQLLSDDGKGEFSITDKPAEDISEDLILHAKGVRKAKEVEGLVIAGVPVATDDRSKIMIAFSLLASQIVDNWTTQWTVGEQAYDIDTDKIKEITKGVQEHINNTFAKFNEVVAQIKDTSIKSYAEIDEAFK